MSTKRSKNPVMTTQSRREYRKSAKRANSRVSTSSHVRRQQRLKLKAERKKSKKPRRRIFPIWLRIIVVLICCVVALAVGLMIGFGVIGEGDPSDALKMETWKHIIDIVTKE